MRDRLMSASMFAVALFGCTCAVAEEKSVVSSRYPVDLYGFIKLDAAYDSSRTDLGNFARWVASDGKNDNQFNMTARQSRLGLRFDGPDVEGMETGGRVEIDFYEGGSENKNRLMMRHAYMQVAWPDYDVVLLAGQTSDVISPLVPPTLNYSVAWWVGDIGYRRPQVRVTKGVTMAHDTTVHIQLAAARTIGDTGPFGAGADSGEDAGFPSLQARSALTFPLLDGKKATVGISGHWGEEEYDFDVQDRSKHLATWSANLDVKLPICKWLTLSGELWTGRNVDAYLGGIAQGMVVESDAGSYVNGKGWDADTEMFVHAGEVDSCGGWLALELGPFDRWSYGVGVSMDDPQDSDLPDDARTQNVSCWGNVRYSINEAVQAGFELSYWDTEYKKARDGDSVRAQTSFIYTF